MGTDYTRYDIADFAADPAFVDSVLSPDEESELFWRRWLVTHPEKEKVLQDARLLVLLMESRQFRLDDNKKENLWHTIQKDALGSRGLEENRLTIAPNGAIEKRPAVRRSFFIRHWYRIAAVFVIGMAMAWSFYTFVYFPANYLVLVNEKGKKSEAYLPDGTKVWLNASSKLTYPVSFEDKSVREVTLDGEAFFDVTPDKSKPFIVQTSQLQVRVLGTAFNVKSYAEEGVTETTLVRGKVMIALNNASQKEDTIMMKEHEQVTYSNTSHALSLAKIHTEPITSWTHGKLVFENKSFADIKPALERWYGVEIKADSLQDSGCRFSTTIEGEPITKVLELFKATSAIDYTITADHTVILKGTLCRN